MPDLAHRGPLGQKTPKPERGTAAAKAHMARVAQLPCVICQSRPVEIHHVICGRYGSRKASDFETISLCYDHHRGVNGIHTSKEAWEREHGPDTDYLPIVGRLIGGKDADRQ